MSEGNKMRKKEHNTNEKGRKGMKEENHSENSANISISKHTSDTKK